MAVLIHTADLHLGRHLHGVRLLEDQRVALEGLIGLIEERQADALIIAGDVYDRSIPPQDAVELLDWFLYEVASGLGVPTVMIAGNHDSGSRLGVNARLLIGGGLHITGPLDPSVQPVVLEDKHGPIEIFPLPFLEPARVREMAQDDTIKDQESAMREMVKRVKARRETERSVLVAHAFVQGGRESDSERSVAIGGAETIAASVFEGFSYVALGHLHRPQHVDAESVCYSGSLLKYSRSEVKYDKTVNVVEIDAEGRAQVEHVGLPLLRDLRHLEGTMEYLTGSGPLGDPDDYVSFQLLDKAPVDDAMARLRKVYPNAVHVEQPQFMLQGAIALPGKDHAERSIRELFEDFFEQVEGESMGEEELLLLDEVLAEIEGEDGS